MKEQKSVFETLSSINVNGKVEKKGNLSYLSWAWAWAEVAKVYPSAQYEIYKNPITNMPYDFVEGEGYMCYTTVTIEDKTLPMWLPVLDYKNKAILKGASMFDINKTIMRCLTKNLSMFGLGSYIYAGEDLPEYSEQVEIKKSTDNRKELKSGTPLFNKAIEKIKAGDGTIEKLLQNFELSKADYNLLTKAVQK